MQPLLPGDPVNIDKYELLGVLGQGGMGRVYLGRSTDDVIVAVKVMRAEYANDPHYLARFRREMQSAEVLGNGYTAALVGCDPDARQPWLATKFIVGGSLSAQVDPVAPGRRPMPLDPGAMWWLAFGLIKALQEIHACGIVHRDLKPANVIMAYDGPKVIDFGIALGLSAGRLTVMGGFQPGTRPFMSPEQRRGVYEIEPSSDIFSLGIVLVFAATGMVPDRIEVDDPPGKLGGIVWHSPALRSLPDELMPLVQRCLRTRPVDRAGLPELLSLVLEAKRGRYQPAEPSFWPEPMATRVANAADAIKRMLPPTVVKDLSSAGGGHLGSREREANNRAHARDEWDEWDERADGGAAGTSTKYPETVPLTVPPTEWLTRLRGSLGGVLLPAYRPALSGTSILDRRPGYERSAADWAMEGDRHLGDGRYAEAVRAYRTSLGPDPKDATDAVVLIDLGRALCLLGFMREAERSFRRALDVSPRLIAARRNLFLAVRHMGGNDPAANQFAEELREACLAVIGGSASSAEEYANLGDAHYTLGQNTDGASAYESAKRLDDDNPRLKEKHERAAGTFRPKGGA